MPSQPNTPRRPARPRWPASPAARRSARTAALVVAGGAALGIAYPPISLAPFAWIALVPLLVAADRSQTRAGVYLVWLGGFLTAWFVAFPWPWFHPILPNAVAGTLAWLLLAMLYAAACTLPTTLPRRLRALGVVAAVLTLEAILRYGPAPLPWAMLGHTQADYAPLWGLAAHGGVESLSLLVLLVNVGCWLAVERFFASPRAVRRAATVAAATAAVLALAHLPSVPASVPDGSLALGVVQPGLGPLAWAGDSGARMRRLVGLTDRLLAGGARVDGVVWPENAVRPEDLTGLDARWPTDLVAGARLYAPDGTGRRGLRNSVVVNGDTTRRYDKRALVPFAEAVPFERKLRALSGLRLGAEGIVAGDATGIATIGGVPVGLSICFETLFPGLFREQVAAGAQLHVAVTQSGWWRSSIPAAQHLAFTRFRALESGRAVLLVAVNGYSALVLPTGRTVWTSEWDRAGARVVAAPLHAGRPPYRRDPVTLPAVAACVVLLIIGARSKGPAA